MNDLDLALVEHSARAVNTLLDAIYQRKPAPAPVEPRSECCTAPLEHVMKDLLACSACGSLCSDGEVSVGEFPFPSPSLP